MKFFINNEKNTRHEFRYAGGGHNSKVFIIVALLALGFTAYDVTPLFTRLHLRLTPRETRRPIYYLGYYYH